MKKFNLRYTGVAMSIMAMSALSAANVANAQEATEEIVVKGTRATIQSSIDQKRIETQIVDGLSADEIGDIPALSIGEALETLTGVSSNRENGGASEVSIRGLGPFLTNTVINGREATNGAGNRAVNFSIFPSELFNKIGVFKTQSASSIEGAVAGQIRLETKKPLEHGKQSIQLSAKAAYNENEQDISGGQDIGYRGTISYIDQFETENFGNFGISIGAQIREETNPESEFRTSGTPRVCNLDALSSDGNPIPSSDGACSDDQFFLRGQAPETPGEDDFATDEDREDFAFLASSATFRQNITDDERNSFFLAGQWQPNERLDLNLDLQLSERIQSERRTDLLFSDLNENNSNDFFLVSEEGRILNSQAGREIQLEAEDFVRDEQYEGIGFNLEYQVNDDLKVSFDASYSNTVRVQTEDDIRLAPRDDGTGEVEVAIDFTSELPTFNIVNNDFDPTVISSFISADFGADGILQGAVLDAAIALDGDVEDRFRTRSQVDTRENTITSLRGDFELQTHDLGIIKSIEGGVRFSELEYTRTGDVDTSFSLENLGNTGDVVAGIVNNCVDEFAESNFLSEELGGNDLITNSAGVGFNSFPSIDATCARNLILSEGLGSDGEAIDPALLEANSGFTGSSIDVEENTFAAYLQANYETELAGLPARGNFGVRLVSTTVDSRSFNNAFEVDNRGSGGSSASAEDITSFEIEAANQGTVGQINEGSNSYTEILPSATLVVDLTDNVLFRGGIFRGLSRPDPAILGERQTIGGSDDIPVIDEDAGFTAADAAAFLTTNAQTGGSVDLDPFTSWNIDAALEWYPNKDTILAAGVYYKKFRGGFQNAFDDREFILLSEASNATNFIPFEAEGFGPNGEFTAPVSTLETTDESSNLYGIELTASHAFTYLPGFLGGFGAKLSYNYASSDFEFEDDQAGAGVGVDGPFVGLVAPTEIFGLSRNVASGQLYWSGGAFDAQVIVKHRSQYFQQFVSDPGRIRTVDDNTVVEFRASYEVTPGVKLSFEALNITDEPRVDFRGLDDNVNQVLSFGPRYFFGIKAKL